jgi:uncharacterized repeat protein (TIGR01451 family)/LPXTG-motif cell wall-anchored protein
MEGRTSRRTPAVAVAFVIAIATAAIAIPVVASAAALSIDLSKTVYTGHDGGAGCPGFDGISAPAGSDVTYCFAVTNTGTEELAEAALSDAMLGVSDSDMTLVSGDPLLLAPGASVVWAYETTITGDLVNIATAGAFPTDGNGNPSYSRGPVVDDDTASVEVEDVTPPPTADIEIEKTIYAGHDSGAGCPGTESVTVATGAAITYCFVVTNTGEAHLADVVVDDTTLGITDADMTLLSGDPALLAPGDSITWYYQTTAGQDLTNVAATTGTPSDENGGPLPDVPPPSDEDDASVEVEVVTPPTADIEIQKTVYGGHDSGVLCPGLEEYINSANSPVTYCFVVTNTGEAHLADVVVDDTTLDITDADMTLLSGDPALLAPGDSITWYYETTIVDDELVNVAVTTGTPADENGTVLPDVPPPTDEDDAKVAIQDVFGQELVPGIRIVKTVYVGHDSGAGCPGESSVFDDYGADITYCFTVTNTGNTYLADVVVDDTTLGITDADMTLASGSPALVAPGASVVWYSETTLDRDLVNTAATTGTPSDEEGNELPAAPPRDEDSATVAQEQVLPQELPATGFSAGALAWFGSALLALGLALLGATGRRRRVASIDGAMRWAPQLWSLYSNAPRRDRAEAPSRRLRR